MISQPRRPANETRWPSGLRRQFKALVFGRRFESCSRYFFSPKHPTGPARRAGDVRRAAHLVDLPPEQRDDDTHQTRSKRSGLRAGPLFLIAKQPRNSSSTRCLQKKLAFCRQKPQSWLRKRATAHNKQQRHRSAPSLRRPIPPHVSCNARCATKPSASTRRRRAEQLVEQRATDCSYRGEFAAEGVH